MQKIMNVGFAFRDEKRGCIIIGGIDDEISLDSLDITGKNIIVKNSMNELVFQVKKIDISTSIAGKINIGLVLSDSIDFNKIKPGDEVLKVIG
jgi:hypothetical protein